MNQLGNEKSNNILEGNIDEKKYTKPNHKSP